MSGGYEIVLWFLLIVASITDLLWGKIYNHLTLTLVVAGVFVRLAMQGVPSATTSIASIGTALLLFFPLYYMKTLAAGDVKLLMAVGAWSTPQLVIQLAFTSIILGAIVGGFILLRKKGLKNSASNMAEAVQFKKENTNKMTRMPFGPAFLCSLLFLKIAEFKGWSFF